MFDEKFVTIDEILEGNSKKFGAQEAKNKEMLEAIDLKAAKFALDKMAESMKRYSILEDYKALYEKVVPPVAKIQE